MLSILIPIFNQDVRTLVYDLANQCSQINVEYEIICLDDCSVVEFQLLNRLLVNQPFVHYKESPVNLGRSKIRNQLAAAAKNDYLLFLDCDSGIIQKEFIRNYLAAISHFEIVCGGRIYSSQKPQNNDQLLHWTYGSKKESKSLKQRRRSPLRYFHSNNFIIQKELFNKVQFDEDLDGYGYEDLVFAQSIKRRGISVEHIDNPTQHLELISTENFIKKTDQAITNLSKWIGLKKLPTTPLISVYCKLIFFHLDGLFSYFYQTCMNDKINDNLRSDHPSITLLQLYKLQLLVSLRKS